MKIIRVLLVLFTASLSSPVFAATSQPYGMGGDTNKFAAMVDQANASGEMFRIQGHCQSACTMFLAVHNVCVERSATLLFHAAGIGAINPTRTAQMASMYNGALRDYVESNHYLDSRTLHAIPGSVIIDRFGYKECPKR